MTAVPSYGHYRNKKCLVKGLSKRKVIPGVDIYTMEEEVSNSSSESSSSSNSDSSSSSDSNSDSSSGDVARDNESESSTCASSSESEGTDDDDTSSTTSSSSPASSSSPMKSLPNGRSKSMTQDFESGSKEAPRPPSHKPTEWLAEVFPKRTPYFPQIGDELIYYRQGHEDYVRYVEKHNLYEMSEEFKKTIPYVAHPKLRAAIPCRVSYIKFEMKGPRLALVVLKLQVIDWRSGEPTGRNLTLQYHEIMDLVDFLILRQVHDKYVSRFWKTGDRFRCLIDTKWWVGTVDRFEPDDRRFPQSKFLCHWIIWDHTGARGKLSPWDMDLITDSCVQSFHTNEFVEATEKEIHRGLYRPTEADWPPNGDQEEQCAKLSRHFVKLMNLAISSPFRRPVDFNRYPSYAKVIAYPIGLSTIKARLENCFYRRRDALRFDVMCFACNAQKIYKRDPDILEQAVILRDLCLELLQNPDISSVKRVYYAVVDNFHSRNSAHVARKRKSKSADGNFPPSQSTREIKAGSSTAIPFATCKSSSQQPAISRSPLKSRIRNVKSNNQVKDYQWKEKCRDLLEKIWQDPDSIPLRAPLPPDDYPGYYEGIDSPLDLQGVREHLLGGHYTSVVDFHENITLIFDKFIKYNKDKSAKIYRRTMRLHSLYVRLVDPILTACRSKDGVTLQVGDNHDNSNLIVGPLPDMTPVIDEYILLLADYNPIAFQTTFHDLVYMVTQLQDNTGTPSSLDC